MFGRLTSREGGRPVATAWVALVGVLALWLSAMASGAAAEPATPPRNLLAHAADDWLWVAEVDPAKPPLAPGDPLEQTQIFARENKPRQPWRLLTTLPGRATMLATRESQLAVLMADGSWMTVWADGTASGQPLPAEGRLRALADDGRSLWGLGLVDGGIAAADAALAAEASASTRPVSMRYGSGTGNGPATTSPSAVAGPTRWVLFRQLHGQWATVAQLPSTVPTSAVDLSVAVVGGNPMVAYLVNGQVWSTTWNPAHQWQDAVPTESSTGKPIADLAVLADPTGPAVWTTTGADAGRLGSRALAWPADKRLSGVPAIALAGGYLRVVGPVGEHVYEQRYDPATAVPVGAPAEVMVPADLSSAPVVGWAQGLLLASLMFTVGTSMFRQATPAALPAGADALSDPGPTASVVTPAPLLARGLAGAIDLLPVAGALVAVLITASRIGDLPPPMEWLLAGAVAVYLAHTAVVEGLTGRSAGKWVMKLRVVTSDGERPAPWQLVSRNLLRLVDPLVQIGMSPLRQRTADMLVGTVVVAATAAVVGPVRPASGG